jgi:hypothetical protein
VVRTTSFVLEPADSFGDSRETKVSLVVRRSVVVRVQLFPSAEAIRSLATIPATDTTSAVDIRAAVERVAVSCITTPVVGWESVSRRSGKST